MRVIFPIMCQHRWPYSSSSCFINHYTVVDCWPKKNCNMRKPKSRKTGLYLVFLHMALAFLLLQTGFTKGFRRLSNQPQVENHEDVDDAAMARLRSEATTQLRPQEQSQIVKTAKKQFVSKTPQYNIRQGTNQMDWVKWSVVVTDKNAKKKKQSRHDSLFCTQTMLMSRLCHKCSHPAEPRTLAWNKHLISPLCSPSCAHGTVAAPKRKSKN